MTLSRPELEELNGLYEQGRYLTLYERVRPFGPLPLWEGPEAMLLAGRLAANLGSVRTAGAILLRAVRQYPHHAEVRYHTAWHIMRRHGPLAAMQFADRDGDDSNPAEGLRADRLAQRARFLAMLRDFEKADQAIDGAIALAPDRPWLWLERAGVLECEDLPDEALESGRKSLQLQPYYRPAVQWVGHLLVQQNRDAEALELLREAAAALESGSVWCQLACLEIELGRYQEAHAGLGRAEHFLPLLPTDKDRSRWIKSGGRFAGACARSAKEWIRRRATIPSPAVCWPGATCSWRATSASGSPPSWPGCAASRSFERRARFHDPSVSGRGFASRNI